MGKKARVLLVSSVVGTIAAALILSFALREHKEDRIEIGAILPLTGSASLLGQGVLEGIQMAADEINANGGIGGRRVVLLVEDSRNDPKEAASAFYKMTAMSKPFAVIAEMSSVSKALAPLAERKQVVVFATVTAAPDLTSMNKWVFRNYYSTRTQGEALASFLAERIKPNRVGILHLTDDYGVTGKNELVASLEKHGMGDVIAEGYAQTATDVRAQATKLLAARVDAICVIAYDEAIARAFQQVRELGYAGTLCTYTGLANTEVLKQAGSSAEGAYVAMADYDPAKPKEGVQSAFISTYKSRHAALPSHYPAFGYDTLMCVARAAGSAGSAPELREQLASLPPFEGVMGTIALSASREVEFPQTVRVVKNGNIVPVGRTEAAP